MLQQYKTGIGVMNSRMKSLILSFALASSATFAASDQKTINAATNAVALKNAPEFLKQFKRLDKADQIEFITRINSSIKIVGGEPAEIEAFRWQVALVRGVSTDPIRSQFCGGTLIQNTVVVTAAHCIDNSIVQSDPARVNIVAGTKVYSSGGERIAVKSIFVHPKWDHNTNDYDVAVLLLAAPSQLGRPIQLASIVPSPGTVTLVSGWGTTSFQGSGSASLRAARIPIVATSDCNATLSYDNSITPRMICGGKEEGGVDSCQGDSGGPMVIGTLNNEQLVGIVSWGEGCAQRLKYGVYTNVAAISGWISAVAPLAANSNALPENVAISLANR
jgi:secreted trypsin-like serine protease